MKQEDKELLLKDLCSRLLYKVKCKYSGEIPMIGEVTNNIGVLSNIHVDKDCPFEINGGIYGFADVKPYLRPMSSMTDEERKEYKHLVAFSGSPDGAANFIDWFNKKMFAYRTIDGKDMFELGIALEAPKGMYNLND